MRMIYNTADSDMQILSGFGKGGTYVYTKRYLVDVYKA